MIQSFGKVTVVSAGTPVQASTNTPTPSIGPWTTCNAILIEAWPNNIGAVYIGNSATMNKSTGAGVVAILAIPTTNFLPSFSATVAYAPGGIDVAQFYIDADTSGDSVIISAVSA